MTRLYLALAALLVISAFGITWAVGMLKANGMCDWLFEGSDLGTLPDQR